MNSYTCNLCGCSKQESEFYACSKTRCKECTKAKALQYRNENIEKVRAYDRVRGLFPHRKERVRANAHKYKFDIEARKEWRRRNPERRAAHLEVQYALRDGRLAKPTTCERCSKWHPRLHGHHEDYSKPLVVIWLCPECHGERHRELNEMIRCEAAE